MHRRRTACVAAAVLATCCSSLQAELTNPDAEWFTVDSGGGVINAYSLTLASTIGQPDAGALTVSNLRLRGGFWVIRVSTNQPPTLLLPIPNFTNVAGSEITITLPANSFSDPNSGQSLSYTVVNLPSGMLFDPSSRTISGNVTQPGIYPLTVVVTDSGYPRLQTSYTFNISIIGSAKRIRWYTVDGGGGQSSANSMILHGTIGQPDAGMLPDGTLQLRGGFWIAPASTNQPPSLLMPIAGLTNKAGINIVFAIPAGSFGDPNGGQSLSYAAFNVPTGLTFNTTNRTFAGSIIQPGAYPVNLVVTDNGYPRLQTHHVIYFIVQESTLQIRWYTLDGGGGESRSKSLSIRGTIGQPDAGSFGSGSWHLRSGFWAAGFTPEAPHLLVTSLADTGPSTLREALLVAAPGATISIVATGAVSLTSGDLLLDRPVRIIGPGAKFLTLSGQNTWRIFDITAGPSFISGVTLANGSDSASFLVGAGIRNNASLTVTECVFSNNVSESAGGAIFNRPEGALVVDRCLFVGNRALGNFQGGGTSGAIGNQGLLFVTNCTFFGNRAGFSGGAIRSTGSLIIESSTFTHNTASECLDCEGMPGIVLHLGTNGVVNNTIMGGNTNVLGAFRDLTGVMDCGDFNLIEFASGYTGTGTNNILGVTPLLGSLVDNGGPTRTHLPLAGSPAIDAGDPASTLTTDQRGFIRPVNGQVDIGAVEATATFISPTLFITLNSPTTVTISWSPATPGFVLQTNLTLNPLTWGDAPSGSTNPVNLQIEGAGQFFRLHKP